MNIKDHLKSRHFDPSLYRSVVVDEDNSVMTLYLWNLSGQFVGYHTYRPEKPKNPKVNNNPKLCRYYTYVSGDKKRKALGVWGLETLNWHDKILCITEGVFDACRLHNKGYPAIAVLCNHPKSLKPWLKTLYKTTVAFCDNDAAGRKLASVCDYSFVANENDLGDMSEEELSNTINELEKLS